MYTFIKYYDSNIKNTIRDLDHYNWLSLRVVVVVVIFSVSPFSCPFDIVVMMDFITIVLELVSVVSLK